VQCNAFYDHLTTHFNKHENDVLTPSKCQHCVKCILHVRHMREHLGFDHKRNEPYRQGEDNNTYNESELDDDENLKATNSDANNKKEDDNDEDYEVSSVASDATSSSTTVVKSNRGRKKSVGGKKEKFSVKSLRKEIVERMVQQTTANTGRKRRRSTLNKDTEELDKPFEDDVLVSSPLVEDPPVKSNSKTDMLTFSNENVYDFSTSESDNPATKSSQRIKTKRASFSLMSSSKLKTSETSSSDPIMPASSPSASSLANSEHSNETFVLKSLKKQPLVAPTGEEQSSEKKPEQTAAATSETAPRPRKQKALKQTTIKRLQRASVQISNNASSPASSTSISVKRKYRRSTVNDSEANQDNLSSPTSPTHPVSTLLFGKIQFNCIKKEFKCIECNESDLKSHYKLVYFTN
jgi:hypothetical protein